MSFREATVQESALLWIVGSQTGNLVELIPTGGYNPNHVRHVRLKPDQGFRTKKGAQGHIFYDGKTFWGAEMTDGLIMIQE